MMMFMLMESENENKKAGSAAKVGVIALRWLK